LEWEGECLPFLIASNPESNIYKTKVVIDSWNNIGKYKEVENSFFIFDEQRLVGYGAWVKAFLKIAKNNHWILLSATPGDTWSDYIPVFIANGFYKNKTDFERRHVVYSPYSKFPKIEKYINQGVLIHHRNSILVDMPYTKPTISNNESIICMFDKEAYSTVQSKRWNIFDDSPIMNASELCYTLRKVVNSDPSRMAALLDLYQKHKRIIVFYNYDYELEALRLGLWDAGIEFSEWNGHKHEPIPETESWAYLVQYTAGAEGWNCIQTDTIVFYSENYSYKIMAQAAGRIDRMNTPFKYLYYYHMTSTSQIDLAITKALRRKKKFNERGFANT
jgi:hypothetical protein